MIIEEKTSLKLRLSENDARWLEDAYRKAYPLSDLVKVRRQLYGTPIPGHQVAAWISAKLQPIMEAGGCKSDAFDSILARIETANEVSLKVHVGSEDLFSLSHAP
jgi:hypothetical protein